jgi:hypothetical protein
MDKFSPWAVHETNCPKSATNFRGHIRRTLWNRKELYAVDGSNPVSGPFLQSGITAPLKRIAFYFREIVSGCTHSQHETNLALFRRLLSEFHGLEFPA